MTTPEVDDSSLSQSTERTASLLGLHLIESTMAEPESNTPPQSSSLSFQKGRPASSSSLRGSFKPASTPSQLLNYSSSEERKSAFLQDVSKSLAKSGGGLRTSITVSEIGVLQSFMIKKEEDDSINNDNVSPPRPTTNANMNGTTDTNVSSISNGDAMRDRFMASVMSKSALLEPNELAFLRKLGSADQDGISDEHLNQAINVLENDPLYQSTQTNERRQRSEDDKAQQVRASLRVSICRPVVEENEEELKEENKLKPSSDQSFRKEIWNEYWQSWSSRQTLVSQASTSADANERQTSSPKKNNGVVKFFQKVFFIPHRKVEEENDGTENDALLEGDIVQEAPFSVLGATPDDEMMLSVMVLTPPIMDALRPNLPYACQQDNFWLKYSMIRNVSNNNEVVKPEIELTVNQVSLFCSHNCTRSTLPSIHRREHLSKRYSVVFGALHELFLPLKPWMVMFWAALPALLDA